MSVKRFLKRVLPDPARKGLARVFRSAVLLRHGGDVRRAKESFELAYWQSALTPGDEAGRAHYERFFTTFFGLTREDYVAKRVLDIGCGPRGSLEWADMVLDRVGVDPLVDSYGRFGIDKHKMTYVNANAENLPFPNGSFDVVSSMNSLDHVDDVKASAQEITRVLAPNGRFLLLSEVGHEPTLTEPHQLGWETVKLFSPPLRIVGQAQLEKPLELIYQSAELRIVFDHSNLNPRSGLLAAVFEKTDAASGR